MRATVKELLEKILSHESSRIDDNLLKRYNIRREDLRKAIPIIFEAAPKDRSLKLVPSRAEKKQMQQIGMLTQDQEILAEENEEQFKKRSHISKLLIKLIKLLLDDEAAKIFFQDQKTKEAYESIRDYLRELSQKRGEEALVALMNALPADGASMMMASHQEQVNRAEKLIHSIDRSKAIILANRKVAREAIVKHINDVQVGNVKTFEGMNAANQADFVNHYLEARESYLKKRLDILKSIEDEEKKAATNGRTDVKFSYNSRNKRNELAALDEQWDEIIKKIGDKTDNKHINSYVSDEECKQHIKAFETHQPIAKQIERFEKVFKTQYKKIQTNKGQLNQISEQAKKEALDNIQKEKSKAHEAKELTGELKVTSEFKKDAVEKTEKQVEKIEKQEEKAKEIVNIISEKKEIGMVPDEGDFKFNLDSEAFSFDDIDDDVLDELSEGERDLSDTTFADLKKEIESTTPPKKATL